VANFSKTENTINPRQCESEG